LILRVAGAFAVGNFGGQFLPELRENHFVVHMRGLPGTSLAQSMDTGTKVTKKIRQHPGIVSVAQQAGRAELGEDTTGVEVSELEVDLGHLNAAQRKEVESLLNGLNNDF